MTPTIFNLANATGDLVAAVAVAMSERGRERLAELQEAKRRLAVFELALEAAVQETERGL